MEQKELKPLSKIRTGEKARLVTIEAGRGMSNRLASMGLVSNTEITVISNSHPGPFVINVKGSRVMLGRGMANKIIVSGCDNEKDKSGSGRKS